MARREVTDPELPVRLATAILARTGAANRAGETAVRLSQSELAETIGATRSDVNRQLSKWMRLGIIAMRNGKMFVLDAVSLESLRGGL